MWTYEQEQSCKKLSFSFCVDATKLGLRDQDNQKHISFRQLTGWVFVLSGLTLELMLMGNRSLRGGQPQNRTPAQAVPHDDI